MKMYFVSVSLADDSVVRVVLSAPSEVEIQDVADRLYPGCGQIDLWYVQEVDAIVA